MDPDLIAEHFNSPASVLDLLRAHPEWSERERDELLGRLVERFPSETLIEAIRDRLQDLRGADAEAMLRLVEAHPEPGLLRELAEAVEKQPDLPPETAWGALAVLDAAGLLDRTPALAERWDELNEVIDEDDSIDVLVEQIEDDPQGIWLALQGLGAVEPDVRAEIVAGLGEGPLGPGLVEFLRLLAYAHDTATREAALGVLSVAGTESPDVHEAWRDLAARHPDPGVASRARLRAESAATGHGSGSAELSVAHPGALARNTPQIVRSVVTAIDGQGRGSIVLGAEGRHGRVTAVFGCDVEEGVREVFGDVAVGAQDANAAFEELTALIDRPVVENSHELALGLLAGSLLLCGPSAPPALRYWVEATAGADFRPQPFRAEFPGWDPASVAFDETAARTSAVLDGCPDWIDASPLTYEMAVEIHLREGRTPPDPRRDAGAYRVLFERRLRDQLERYRRMLLWMAWFWRAGGDDARARSALALAWQLSDAQHVVPGHPFTVALTTRSLAAAMERIDQGIPPVT
jgi:hypothetical protein